MNSLHWMVLIVPFPTMYNTQACALAQLEANLTPSDEPTEEECDR